MEQLEEGDKEKIEEQLEQMDLDQKPWSRNWTAPEQFKQLQWEQKMEEAISDLEKLAEEQEKLAEETAEGETPEEDLKAKQDSLDQEFDKIQEALTTPRSSTRSWRTSTACP